MGSVLKRINLSQLVLIAWIFAPLYLWFWGNESLVIECIKYSIVIHGCVVMISVLKQGEEIFGLRIIPDSIEQPVLIGASHIMLCVGPLLLQVPELELYMFFYFLIALPLGLYGVSYKRTR